MQYKIRQFYHFMQWSSETIFIKKQAIKSLKSVAVLLVVMNLSF